MVENKVSEGKKILEMSFKIFNEKTSLSKGEKRNSEELTDLEQISICESPILIVSAKKGK